jgi:hypothetical protein
MVYVGLLVAFGLCGMISVHVPSWGSWVNGLA